MVVEQQDELFSLLQFIALALPAIVIYLQVLIHIYQKQRNVELKGSVPKAYKDRELTERAPENDPNVIEAVPTLVTNAKSKPDFILALVSLVVFLFGALALTGRLLVAWDFLISIGSFLAGMATILFAIAILLTVWNILKSVFQS